MMEYYEFDAWLSWVNRLLNRSYGVTRFFPQHQRPGTSRNDPKLTDIHRSVPKFPYKFTVSMGSINLKDMGGFVLLYSNLVTLLR